VLAQVSISYHSVKFQEASHPIQLLYKSSTADRMNHP